MGYSLECYHEEIKGVSGLAFEIESCEYNPLELEERILVFIQDFYTHKFTEAVYESCLRALINQRL